MCFMFSESPHEHFSKLLSFLKFAGMSTIPFLIAKIFPSSASTSTKTLAEVSLILEMKERPHQQTKEMEIQIVNHTSS